MKVLLGVFLTPIALTLVVWLVSGGFSNDNHFSLLLVAVVAVWAVLGAVITWIRFGR